MLWHAYTSLHHSSTQPQICHPAIASACQNILEKCMTQWDALAAHKIVDCICICCCVQPQHSLTWVVNMKVYQKVQCKVMTCPSTDLFHARPCIQLLCTNYVIGTYWDCSKASTKAHTGTVQKGTPLCAVPNSSSPLSLQNFEGLQGVVDPLRLECWAVPARPGRSEGFGNEAWFLLTAHATTHATSITKDTNAVTSHDTSTSEML